MRKNELISRLFAPVLLLLPLVPQLRAADWPHAGSDLPPDPAVHWIRLDNGVRLVILPNHEPRGRISLRLHLEAGSLQEEDHERGLAHYLEHMAFNGTENFAAGTLVEYFQRLGMSFGADTNAYTSFDRTVYMIELPDTRPESLDEGLLVLRDYADRMLIEEEEVERERGVILAEMRSRDSVAFRTALAQFAFLLPDSIIPRRFPIGTEETVRAIGRGDLAAFFDAWYRPERTILVAVGELDPETTSGLMQRHFADFAARAPAVEEPDMGEVRTGMTTAMLHSEPEAPATRVSIQTVKPFHPEPDTLHLRTQRLRRSAALAMLNRRLETLAKEEGAPFTRGTAQAYELLRFATIGSIELTCEPENWDASLALAERELRRALLFGFDEGELREIRALMLNNLREQANRAETRRSPVLAEALVSSLANQTVFLHPRDERDLLVPVLEAMTVEEALTALRQLWSVEGRFLFVTGNLELEDPEETILAIHARSGREPVEPPARLEDVPFAYTDFGPVGTVSRHIHDQELDIHQIRFENGVRLNLKTTGFQANTVLARARFGSGRLEKPAEMPGLATLAEAVFTAGGLGQHDSDQLRRILAGRNAGVRFSVAMDAFEMDGATTPADLPLQLQLMTAFLTDPGYRPESLRLALPAIRERYRHARHTAQGTIQNEVGRFLVSGDHRFGLPPENRLSALTLEDVASWLEEPLAQSLLEVTLVGDFELEEAIAAAAATFGALPPRKEIKTTPVELRRVSFPRGEESRTFFFQSNIPQAHAMVYWPTTDMWDIRKTRRLQVLARLFSDRMRIKIREEMGEAYSPHAQSRPDSVFPGHGWFAGMVGVDPAKADEVAAAVKSIAEEMVLHGVDDDELQRALRPLLTSLRDTLRDNRYWLNSVLASSQEYPRRLQWSREIMTDHEAITAGEINALARRFLRPGHALKVFVMPQEETADGRSH